MDLVPSGPAFVAHNSPLELPVTQNSRRINRRGPYSERHLVLRNPLACPNGLSLIFCVNPRSLLPSPVLLLRPLVTPTPELVSRACHFSHPRILVGRSQGGLSRSGLCVSSYSDRLLVHLRFGLGGRFDIRLLSITERSLLGSSDTLVYGRISITLYILCDWCTTSPLSWTFAQFVPHICIL